MSSVKFTSKIDILDKYSKKKPVKKQRYGRKGNIEIYYEEEQRFYCKEGDELKVITKNAGSWCISVIVENKEGQRFSIKWENIKAEVNFSLDD